MAIKLVQRVKDSITGYEGTAICRAEWLYGCLRITIQGDLDKDGKMPGTICIDEEQLIVIESVKKVNEHKESESPAGPRNDPQRNSDPVRQNK